MRNAAPGWRKEGKEFFPCSVLMGGNKLDEGDISIRWIVSAGGMVFTAGEFVEPSHG
jgi:hypothetical protein